MASVQKEDTSAADAVTALVSSALDRINGEEKTYPRTLKPDDLIADHPYVLRKILRAKTRFPHGSILVFFENVGKDKEYCGLFLPRSFAEKLSDTDVEVLNKQNLFMIMSLGEKNPKNGYVPHKFRFESRAAE